MANQRTSSESGNIFAQKNENPSASLKHGVQITAIQDGKVWMVTQLVQKSAPSGPYTTVKNCKRFVPIGDSNFHKLLTDAVEQGIMGKIQKARRAKLARRNENAVSSKLGTAQKSALESFLEC